MEKRSEVFKILNLQNPNGEENFPPNGPERPKFHIYSIRWSPLDSKRNF